VLSLHLQAKFDSPRNLLCCAISGIIVWKVAMILLHISFWISSRMQLWYSPRRSNRIYSNLMSVPAKRSDHPDQFICLENVHPEFPVLSKIMCGSSIVLKNQRFPLSERNVIKRIGNWFSMKSAYVLPLRYAGNKYGPIWKSKCYTKQGSRKNFLIYKNIYHSVSKLLPIHWSITDTGRRTVE